MKYGLLFVTLGLVLVIAAVVADQCFGHPAVALGLLGGAAYCVFIAAPDFVCRRRE